MRRSPPYRGNPSPSSDCPIRNFEAQMFFGRVASHVMPTAAVVGVFLTEAI
jgi:hypothetical protein